MKPSVPRLAPLLALAGALLASGCSRGEEPGAPAAGAGELDTGNLRALDGLSAEQIQEQARPLTPEQAEALGIVDTTIHVESLQSPEDSATMEGAARRAPAPPPDTARDTAPG